MKNYYLVIGLLSLTVSSAFANEIKVNIGKYQGQDLNKVRCEVEIKEVKYCKMANENCIVATTSLGGGKQVLLDQFVDIVTNDKDDQKVDAKIEELSPLVNVEYSGTNGLGSFSPVGGTASRLGVSVSGKPIYMSFGKRGLVSTYKNLCILQ